MKSGPEQLKDWMHRRRFMSKEAAEHLGWHETYVSQLVNGARTPSLINAIKLERETGIPVESWVSSEVDNNDDPEPAIGSKHQKTKA